MEFVPEPLGRVYLRPSKRSSQVDPDPTETTMANLKESAFSPYRADGKLYGFVCVVTGASQPIGQAIVAELAGKLLPVGMSHSQC